MTETNPPNEATRAVDQLNTTQQTMNQASESIIALRTEADRASSILGFGRRIWVPADEVHVVVGNGLHITRSAAKSDVFGQAAEKPTRYWLNPRTKVIKLKTISFTVPLLGPVGQGIDALDSNKVSFKLWAHAVAQLNPKKAEVAARRIGQDTKGLVRTITQVAMSQLIEAAATMPLSEIIANRQSLAKTAFGHVNDALGELGYDLSVLTVTQLAGDAYLKLVKQAESRVSKETTITINKEQLAEQEDIELRSQREAQITAETRQKQAAVEAITTEKLVATERAKQKAMLEKVALDKELEEAEVEKRAILEQKEAEYAAQIKAIEVEKAAEIKLQETDAEAQRMALAQIKKIERDAELTEAEADRLRKQELTQAERAKEVALVKESEEAESQKVQAEAAARALAIRTQAEADAELARAEAQAKATEKLALAAAKRAEATKAEEAASGLAEAEVAEAQVQVAEKQVQVTRAEGLADAEVASAKAQAEAERLQKIREVEINAQKQLAAVYLEAPMLVELEKLRMQLSHDKEIARIRAEASLKAFEALAPGMKVNLYGNGGQMGEILNGLMTLSHGMQVIGDEVPVVGRMLNQAGTAVDSQALASLTPQLTRLMPSISNLVKEMSPRMLTSLTVADMVERLGKVVSGQEDLVTALNQVKNDASFRLVGNLPIQSVLGLLNLAPKGSENGEMVEDIPIT